MSKLTRDLKCVVTFFLYLCVMQDLHSGMMKGISREADSLYNIQLPIRKESKSHSIKLNIVNSDKLDNIADMEI